MTNQRKIILAYLEERFEPAEYVLVDFYIDDGRTGTTEDTRPAFLRMVADIDSGAVNCVICKTLSRAFRNYADQGRFLEQYLPARRCRFIAIGSPHVDTFTDPGCVQNLEIPISGLMNDRFAARTSADVRRTLDTKRRRGEFIGAFPPYGYRKSPEDKNKLLVDEEAAQVVRDIFHWFVREGMSKGGIARRLNALGVPNPSAYKRSQGLPFHTPSAPGNDGLWSPTTVSRILRDVLYTGVLRQGRQRVVSYKVHTRMAVPESQWFLAAGAVAPVVSRELFQAAQALQERSVRAAPRRDDVYPFSGLLICGDCGKAMHRRCAKGHVYYACRTFTDKSRQRCGKHTLREDAAALAVLTVLQRLMELSGGLEDIADQLRGAAGERTEPSWFCTQLLRRERDLAQAAERLDGLYDDWKGGVISREQYLRLRERYEARSVLLRQQIQRLREEEAAAGGPPSPDLAAFLRQHSIHRLSRGLLVELVQAIYVHQGGALEVVFRFQDPYRQILDQAGGEPPAR